MRATGYTMHRMSLEVGALNRLQKSESRTIATCYALRGYFASEQDYDTSRDIRHAVNYLVSTVNKDGGWGQREGLSSDPSNTARVISTLLESGQYTPNHTLIERAQSYILHSQDCWRFRVESYVVSGAPGQVYFHSNTLVDVLEALVCSRYFGQETHDLISFLLRSQDERQGFWNLLDFSDVDKSICTWTTSEALGVIDFAHEEYSEHLLLHSGLKFQKRWQLAFAGATLFAVIELLYIAGVHTVIREWWCSLTEGWKQVIVGSIIIGFIVSICANLLSGKFRSMLGRVQEFLAGKEEE